MKIEIVKRAYEKKRWLLTNKGMDIQLEKVLLIRISGEYCCTNMKRGS